MHNDFMRTLRSMRADDSSRTIKGILAAALVAGVWSLWLVGSEISLYEITRDARLEVDRAVFRIAAPLTGRVVSQNLLLGQRVEAGEVVAELDSEAQRFQVQEVETRRGGLESEIDPLQRELAAATQALADLEAAGEAELKEVLANVHEGQIAFSFASDEAERLGHLEKLELVAGLKAKRARVEAVKRRSIVESREHRLLRLKMDYKRKASEARTRIEDIKHELAEVEGKISTAKAVAGRLEHEVKRRRITAPVSGRIGEVSPVKVGSVAAEGEVLGTIVTPGDLRIIAEYPPAFAVGRIKPGQKARLRLDGFPWIQYGSIPASVVTVGDEPREGRIRVELVNDHSTPSRLTLVHGMTGMVEVEVERISPARLLLRAVGKRLGDSVAGNDPP